MFYQCSISRSLYLRRLLHRYFSNNYNIFGDTLYVIFIAIHPKYRNEGVASNLIKIIKQQAENYNVKKIKFEEAEITFKASREVPLACILISSDSSITLRSSFDKFADDVFKDYKNIFETAFFYLKYCDMFLFNSSIFHSSPNYYLNYLGCQ